MCLCVYNYYRPKIILETIFKHLHWVYNANSCLYIQKVFFCFVQNLITKKIACIELHSNLTGKNSWQHVFPTIINNLSKYIFNQINECLQMRLKFKLTFKDYKSCSIPPNIKIRKKVFNCAKLYQHYFFILLTES